MKGFYEIFEVEKCKTKKEKIAKLERIAVQLRILGHTYDYVKWLLRRLASSLRTV